MNKYYALHPAPYGTTIKYLGKFKDFGGASDKADEILTEGEGQIKMFICTAGNPVLSTPNGKKLEKALDKLEFMVVSLSGTPSEIGFQADFSSP